MKKAAITLLLLSFFLITATSVSAQDTETTTSTSGYELPVGPDTGTTENEASTDTNTTEEGKTQEQTTDFIKGLAAGTVFGLVIGGVLAWFIKKS